MISDHLQEELAVLDVFDGLRRSRVEPGAVGTTFPGSPALLGVKGPDEFVASRVFLRIAIFAIGRCQGYGHRSEHAACQRPRVLFRIRGEQFFQLLSMGMSTCECQMQPTGR